MTRWRASFAAAALALAVGCSSLDDVLGPDEILLLTASPDSIPADGFSTSRIVATVNPRVDRALVFAFESTAGATIPATALSPDENGSATTFLKSGTTPGSVVVTVKIKRADIVEATRTVTVTLTPSPSGSVVKLFVSSPQIEADGVSSVQVRAEVNAAAPNRNVKLETSNGSFAPGNTPTRVQDTTLSADGMVRALLYAPAEIGSAIVTASSNGFSASETVTFVRALPDAISLGAAPLSLQASETATSKITASVSRALGRVSPGARVDFSAVNDETGQGFGRFQAVIRTTASEQATADFVAGLGAPLGLATITARVADTTLSAQVKILITK